MTGVLKMRFSLGCAAVLLPASVLAQAPAPLVCPEGTLPTITDRERGIKQCVPKSFVSGYEKLTAPAQLDELQAWRRHDDAMHEYEKHHSAYVTARTKRDGEQNQLDRKNCGNLPCDTQRLTSSIKGHESEMNRAYARMDEAGRICAWHAQDVNAARAEEKKANLASVSLRNPTCPLGSKATGTRPVGGAIASGDNCADVRAKAGQMKGGARLAIVMVSGDKQSVKMVPKPNELPGAKFAPVTVKLVYSSAHGCMAAGTVTATCAPPTGKGAFGVFTEPQCVLLDGKGAPVRSLTLQAANGLVTFNTIQGFGSPGAVPISLTKSGYAGLDTSTFKLNLTMLPQ